MLLQAHPSNLLLTDPLRERTIEKQKIPASYLSGGVDQFAMGIGMKCEQIDATKRKSHITVQDSGTFVCTPWIYFIANKYNS